VELSIVNTEGQTAGTLDVADAAFAVPFNEPLVHQVVVAYQAAARAGTHAQKNRSAVRGGGSKPWRQKGTGRARAGTIRSPLWRGGGRTFAAVPRDYSQKVNRKMQRAAVRSILSELVRQERLVVVENLSVDVPKTAGLFAILRNLQCTEALLVTAETDVNLSLSARNLPGVNVCTTSQVDPLSLVAYDRVVITVDALQKLEEIVS
jgi:large subunit ribosomal protein L4